MGRKRISEDLYKLRILEALENKELPAYKIAQLSKIGFRENEIILNSMVSEGKLIKIPITITKFVYKLNGK